MACVVRWSDPCPGEGGAALRWSGRRVAPTALRCSVGRAGAELAARSFGPLRSDSCAESVHEACLSCGRHAARPPCAPRRSTGAPLRPHRGRGLRPWWLNVPRWMHPDGSTRRGRGPGAGAICGAARSAGQGRACQRSMARFNSDLLRLFERSGPKERAVSCAAPPLAEHRSGVGATRRPPHHEPAPQAPGHAARLPASPPY